MAQHKEYAQVLQPSARSFGQLPDVQFYSSSTAFYTTERSVISVTPQLLALGNCSARGSETKYLHPCWDMNLDIWACGSYPMQYCWVYYNERMVQQSFINKIRMLQLTRCNTIGRSSTHARMTCRAFLL
jgi:hypothetical protein